jgi:hypothetical protein
MRAAVSLDPAGGHGCTPDGPVAPCARHLPDAVPHQDERATAIARWIETAVPPIML